MLRPDHSLFDSKQFDGLNSPTCVNRTRRGLRDHINSIIPSRSLNLSRANTLKTICNSIGSNQASILVVGSGNQAADLERSFSGNPVALFYCDIAPSADVDVYCDAHELPFAEEQFDGVISTAVLEHVMYPDVVAGEVYRVVKHGGFVYTEIPFLQGVHEGAYDFFRCTMGAHRRLFEKFEETSSGMVAGPGTVLVWSLDLFMRGIFRSPRAAKLARIATRFAFFWLKYFDYLMRTNPAALDGASCTYFYGKKTGKLTSHKNIVERYLK